MNTYEKQITFGDKEYYLATEFYFDHREQLQFRDFLMEDENGENISVDELKENAKLFQHVESLLVDELCICYAGAPC